MFFSIISFFGLVITGFPLKYHSTPWAGAIIRALGGAHNAGFYHRIAALILIGLFLYTLWRCFRFAFPKGFRKEGWRGFFARIFGPDSLMPNAQDWRQFKAMVKWFFGKGKPPTFGRWTYWEKFDFLAVFWGMIAIGGSGVTLWAPELASHVYPGWVLNIASIVHSEEALLAALFIFTVHFFNTHLIPSKFPMDTIIFTGSYKLEELWRFRTPEYERLMKEGKLDDLKVKHPSITLKTHRFHVRPRKSLDRSPFYAHSAVDIFLCLNESPAVGYPLHFLWMQLDLGRCVGPLCAMRLSKVI